MLDFLTPFFEYIIKVVSAWGYWGVGIGMTLESACIPIPSEIILPLGGYMAYTGRLSFWGAVFFGMLGGLTGSTIAYFVGYYGGRPFIIKYGKYILINHEDFEKADRWFNKYGEVTVFTSRLLPVIRTFISLPAGIARVGFKRFIFFTVLGSLPWTIALTYAGFALGQNWRSVKQSLKAFDELILIGLILLVAIYVYKHVSKKKRLPNA